MSYLEAWKREKNYLEIPRRIADIGLDKKNSPGGTPPAGEAGWGSATKVTVSSHTRCRRVVRSVILSPVPAG